MSENKLAGTALPLGISIGSFLGANWAFAQSKAFIAANEQLKDLSNGQVELIQSTARTDTLLFTANGKLAPSLDRDFSRLAETTKRIARNEIWAKCARYGAYGLAAVGGLSLVVAVYNYFKD